MNVASASSRSPCDNWREPRLVRTRPFSAFVLRASSMSLMAPGRSFRPAVAFARTMKASAFCGSRKSALSARDLASRNCCESRRCVAAFTWTSTLSGRRSAARTYSCSAPGKFSISSYACARRQRASPNRSSIRTALRYSTIASLNFCSAASRIPFSRYCCFSVSALVQAIASNTHTPAASRGIHEAIMFCSFLKTRADAGLL